MAAAELLDYNQVQEQSPSTGDSIPTTGGPIIWQFRADPNLAWDPSQSFFAMDVTVKSYGKEVQPLDGSFNTASSVQPAYIPAGCDLRPFFPLRCFNGASHVIDGVTVASTTHPYLDKVLQEKFLHESTLSNMGNFESLQLARAIDDGIREHNIFKSAGVFNISDMVNEGWSIYSIESYTEGRAGQSVETVITQSNGQGGSEQMPGIRTAKPTHTIMFQPPFDFWTKHQRVSGGNHQITLNLRPEDPVRGHGLLVQTPCVGLDYVSLAGTNGVHTGVPAVTRSLSTLNKYTEGLYMKIDRIRLFRRMVRFTVERPIATQEFNLTEMQLYVGQPQGQNGSLTEQQMSQNFLLPSSTFGLVFWWRQSNNEHYDVVGDYPRYDKVTNTDSTPTFDLKQFYFTYGGETYPSQRITDIATNGGDGAPYGYEKLQMITNQLMGVYNMPMEYLNTSFTGRGLMDRLDSQMFFFPVAKHSNSDNSDLQVFWEAQLNVQATLCVAALYDARIELSFNAANQLEKVTKTEWK